MKIQAINATAITAAAPTVEDVTGLFLADQDVNEKSKKTYKGNLKQFFLWVELTGRQIVNMKHADILEYKKELLARQHSELTVAGYIQTVRGFFKWAESRDLHANIAANVKAPRRYRGFKKDPLEAEQVKKLLRAIDKKTERGLRDFAFISLMLRCGLRTIEITRADVGDIQVRKGAHVLYIQGKGRTSKDEFVILTKKAHKALKLYIDTRIKAKQKEPLFVSYSNRTRGKRLDTATIRGRFKFYCRKIGIDTPRITAHSARHTAATMLLSKTGDAAAVQEFMRHKSGETTKLYTASIADDLRLERGTEKELDKLF
ncbi:MAG: tyrosine-type recombinase/integrase [bacterium]|nr:tyrosine-type recombinase/integrase [bacterium]